LAALFKRKDGQEHNPQEIHAQLAGGQSFDFSMSTRRKQLARKPRGASRASEREDSQPPLHPILQMQQKAGNRAVVNLLNESAPQIQRAPLNGEAQPTNTPAVATGGLIVADDAPTAAPGQMRKSEFLAQLRSTVCTTADEALKEAGETTEGCPYIEQWLAYYTDQEPAHIERALRKYAPEAATATTAHDYIPAVSNRVRLAVQNWARTGEVTGVPEELAGMLPGAGLGAVLGGAVSAIGSAIGSVFSGIGRALFKRKNGEERPDPQAIQAQLDEGRPLDGNVSSRMGAAFGMDFSDVRVHTDAEATGLSERLNARAFTIGSDIAFGAGEYQPGTLVGDALIAHELAHVAQQGSSSEAAPLHKDDDSVSTSLEEDADSAAVQAVMSSRGEALGRNSMPRLKSQLRLQSCKKYKTNKGTEIVTRYTGHEQQVLTPTGTIETRNAPNKTEAEADAQLSALGLLGKVTKLAPPTNDYDCHGYTFLDGDRWIDDDQVPTILAENGYSETSTPVVGDIVVYWNGGQPKHSGKITEVKGGTVTKITSKWGLLGLYSHAPNDVPATYGSWKAYHTTRAGGHRLHYER
jgi:hypothetical protein